jgi:uncharacterized metal-binding protein
MDDTSQWQREIEQERLQRELEALQEIDRAGFHETAQFLATELGIAKEFNQEVNHG